MHFYFPRTRMGGVGLMPALALLALSAKAGAATIAVSPTGKDDAQCLMALHPCQTIQFAVSQAFDGDVIELDASAGAFFEHDILVTKSITIRSAKAGSRAVIDATGRGRVIEAVLSHNGSLTLENLRIEGGAVPSGWGGGVLAYNGLLTVLSSEIARNEALVGGGIYAGESLSVYDSTVEDNSAQWGGGIGFQWTTAANISSTMELRGSTVKENRAANGGAELWLGVL